MAINTADVPKPKNEIEEQPVKIKSVVLGKEITPNNVWLTMSIEQFGTTYVITEVANAVIHSLVRTITQENGKVLHTSMTVVPNFKVKQTKDIEKNDIVVFTRGI